MDRACAPWPGAAGLYMSTRNTRLQAKNSPTWLHAHSELVRASGGAHRRARIRRLARWLGATLKGPECDIHTRE